MRRCSFHLFQKDALPAMKASPLLFISFAALVASVALFVGATYAWSTQATVNAGNKITVSTTKANDAAKSGDSADVDSSATASDAPKEEDAAGEVNRDETSSSDSGVSSDAQSSTSTEQGQGKESSDGSANEGITP